MKNDQGQNVGPRGEWGNWRSTRDKAITKPRRNKAVERLEQLNKESTPASLDEAIAQDQKEIDQ
jgi:hypothetical protein